MNIFPIFHDILSEGLELKFLNKVVGSYGPSLGWQIRGQNLIELCFLIPIELISKF